ncbi:hypothetical protein [Nocardia sp. NPDC005998]|uniref:hypothetical protein n=1 Tax=Nocardia sp. NPDC005998 TaxID=3156894 RepID=UPI0033B614B8
MAGRHISAVIGNHVRTDIDVASIYRELADRWHVHYILPNQSSYFDDPEIAEH